jgi:hypothetical protein
MHQMTNNDLRFLEVFSVSDPFVTGQMSKLIQSCQSRTEQLIEVSRSPWYTHPLTFAALWFLNTLKTFNKIKKIYSKFFILLLWRQAVEDCNIFLLTLLYQVSVSFFDFIFIYKFAGLCNHVTLRYCKFSDGTSTRELQFTCYRLVLSL